MTNDPPPNIDRPTMTGASSRSTHPPLGDSRQQHASAPTRDATRRLAAPHEGLLEPIWLAGSDAPADVFEQVLELAIEIAREGREGRRIGTMFTVGDHE